MSEQWMAGWMTAGVVVLLVGWVPCLELLRSWVRRLAWLSDRHAERFAWAAAKSGVEDAKRRDLLRDLLCAPVDSASRARKRI